jgi:branched-chain amino acid transport system substrate-binding protein
MKRKFYFTFVVTLALCLALLVGCADKPSKPTGTAPIKLGGIGPLTGGAAVYGIAVANGAKIAVDEINALGGIQFELNFQDDEHDAEKSVNAYNVLKDWGMQILVGTVTT